MLQRKTSVAAALLAASKVGACALVAVGLAGCGQKGPLTLAKPPSPAATAATQTPAAPAASAAASAPSNRP